MTSTELIEAYWSRYGDVPAFVQGLVERMRKHRISQGRLARRAGFDPAHVSRWIGSRTVEPTRDTLVILDEAVESLIRGE